MTFDWQLRVCKSWNLRWSLRSMKRVATFRRSPRKSLRRSWLPWIARCQGWEATIRQSMWLDILRSSIWSIRSWMLSSSSMLILRRKPLLSTRHSLSRMWSQSRKAKRKQSRNRPLHHLPRRHLMMTMMRKRKAKSPTTVQTWDTRKPKNRWRVLLWRKKILKMRSKSRKLFSL